MQAWEDRNAVDPAVLLGKPVAKGTWFAMELKTPILV